MCTPARIFIIDDNFREIVSFVGLYYPKTAPVPANGCVVEVQGGGLGFLGFDGEQWEIVAGACPTARNKWYVRHIRDYWEQDLYLREIDDVGWEAGERLVRDPTTGITCCGFLDFLAGMVADGKFLVDLVYEHDVHDHSYKPALATAAVTCSVDLQDGRVVGEGCAEHGPPTLYRKGLREKMMPGDYVPIGKVVTEKLCSHITEQGSKEPITFPCLRDISSE
jgi:hypothetical protein